MHIGHRSEMCLFTTSLTPEESPLSIRVEYALAHVFDAPGVKVDRTVMNVPLAPELEGLDHFPVNMHFSPCTGYDMGEHYNLWFSERFGYSVKLLYIGANRRKVLGNLEPAPLSAPGDTSFALRCSIAIVLVLIMIASWMSPSTRGVLSNRPWVTIFPAACLGGVFYAPGRSLVSGKPRSSDVLTFSDLAPLLVISSKSLDNVRNRLENPSTLDAARFRPNIVVSGAKDDFEEDFWSELCIGSAINLALTQNCARCSSLNVDYSTGKAAPGDAGKILKLLSRDRRVDPGTKWSPVFGRYGFLRPQSHDADVPVTVRVGDVVKVVQRNTERTVMGKPGRDRRQSHRCNHRLTCFRLPKGPVITRNASIPHKSPTKNNGLFPVVLYSLHTL